MKHVNLEYAGFWLRTGAALVDTIIILIIAMPLSLLVYGWGYFDSDKFIRGSADLAINYLLPLIATIILWRRFQATPGKMALKLRIVDAVSGETASVRQCCIRYFGYLISALPLGLGLIWVAFDQRKQGWHDKMAGTVVVRDLKPLQVNFRGV